MALAFRSGRATWGRLRVPRCPPIVGFFSLNSLLPRLLYFMTFGAHGTRPTSDSVGTVLFWPLTAWGGPPGGACYAGNRESHGGWDSAQRGGRGLRQRVGDPHQWAAFLAVAWSAGPSGTRRGLGLGQRAGDSHQAVAGGPVFASSITRSARDGGGGPVAREGTFLARGGAAPHPSARVYCSLRTWRKSPFKNVVITSTYRKLRPKNRGEVSFRVVSVCFPCLHIILNNRIPPGVGAA